MFLAVEIEFLMALSTAVCIGLMVVFGVPLLLCLWRFIKEMIQQVKDAQSYLYEIVDDKRAEYFASYLQEETDKQRTIRETGLEAYQKEKKTAMFFRIRFFPLCPLPPPFLRKYPGKPAFFFHKKWKAPVSLSYLPLIKYQYGKYRHINDHTDHCREQIPAPDIVAKEIFII